MTKKIACLHAHHSNIDYIQKALLSYDVECMHFVDPGLMNRVTYDHTFQLKEAKAKVIEQINWIAQSKPDIILLTCTNYIALLEEEQFALSIPIIKIDEPYFEKICSIKQPQIIAFTNPATVQGTMERLNAYAAQQGFILNAEVVVIGETFELMLEGKTDQYNEKIISYLQNIIKKDNRTLSVAQLSMVNASQQVENETGINIINPLHTLIEELVKQLKC